MCSDTEDRMISSRGVQDWPTDPSKDYVDLKQLSKAFTN